MTTSSTSNSDPLGGPLVRCGIDVEGIRRFDGFVSGAADPDSLIFHPAESAAARASADPARWLCACFCAKEAVFKALGSPFNYRHLEFLPTNAPPAWRWHGGLDALDVPAGWRLQIEMNDSEHETWVSVVFYAPFVTS